MRMRNVLILFIAIFATAVVAPIPANDDAVPFTSAELDKFLDDWPRFVRWAEERGREIGSISTPSEMMGAFARFDAGSFLRDAGWDPDRFSYVAGHAWMAVIEITAREQLPGMIAGIDEAIASLRANPRLTAEQRRTAIDELTAAKALMLGLDAYFEVDPAEVELVRARQELVRKVLRLD